MKKRKFNNIFACKNMYERQFVYENFWHIRVRLRVFALSATASRKVCATLAQPYSCPLSNTIHTLRYDVPQYQGINNISIILSGERQTHSNIIILIFCNRLSSSWKSGRIYWNNNCYSNFFILLSFITSAYCSRLQMG